MATALPVLVLIGGMFVLIGVGSFTGRLRRNSLVGIRIPSTLATDTAWAAGHRAAAPLNTALGAFGLVLALALSVGWLPVEPEMVMLCYTLCLLVAVVPMVMIAGRAAKRAS